MNGLMELINECTTGKIEGNKLEERVKRRGGAVKINFITGNAD